MRKEDVYEYFGGCAKVAKALGISTASVAGWGPIIPLGRAYQIESLTVRALQVDPSLYEAA